MEWFEKLKSWLEIKDTIEIFQAETNSVRGCYSTKAIKYLDKHIITIKKISNPNIAQLYLDEIKLLKQII